MLSARGIDRHLKTILISDILDDPTNNEESAEVYPALQRIGRLEGFTIKVVEASPSVWIRDDFLTLSDGTLLAPSQSPHVQQALIDLKAYRDPPGHVYAADQGRVGRNHEIAAYEANARENGLFIRISRVYLEGGNVMVVPKADGTMGVYALNARTGAMAWQFPTGSSIESSPAVAGNVVYVGSDDRDVYALNALTGAEIWKFLARGTVESSPALEAGGGFGSHLAGSQL